MMASSTPDLLHVQEFGGEQVNGRPVEAEVPAPGRQTLDPAGQPVTIRGAVMHAVRGGILYLRIIRQDWLVMVWGDGLRYPNVGARRLRCYQSMTTVIIEPAGTSAPRKPFPNFTRE